MKRNNSPVQKRSGYEVLDIALDYILDTMLSRQHGRETATRKDDETKENRTENVITNSVHVHIEERMKNADKNASNSDDIDRNGRFNDINVTFETQKHCIHASGDGDDSGMSKGNRTSADQELSVVKNITFAKDQINGTIYKKASYAEDYRATQFDNQEHHLSRLK